MRKQFPSVLIMDRLLFLVIIPKQDCMTTIDTTLSVLQVLEVIQRRLKTYVCKGVRGHFIGSAYRHCHLREWT